MLGLSRGFWIPVATFVPTFLVIVIGIPYLASLPMATRFPVGLKGSTPPVVSSLAPKRGFVGAPPQEPAATIPSELPAASTVTKDASWILAAALADRDAAESLAASIERQGYPVEVRRGDSATTPWVVRIGKHPRGIVPSERRQ